MKPLAAAAALCALLAAQVQAQPTFDGFLCCNMRSDGKWISDGNYADTGKTVIPLGTPVKVTGYGRHRVAVEIDGKPQHLGNDYSRDIALPAFARRYVVAENPAARLASYPPAVREAIESARISPGMTREQVLMALGYPMSSENPHLDARLWKYWLWTFAPFDVAFGDDGRVSSITTDPDTRRRVVKD